MIEPLFISQAKLESWVESGKVRFQDNVLTLLEEEVSYKLAPAVRITALLDGQDSAGILNQIRTIRELEAIGAESYHDSVILGETAYQCEEGFAGTQSGAPPARKDPTPAPIEAPPAAADGSGKSDMDLLTDFLLKHM